MSVAPSVAVYNRDWLYAFLLGLPVAFRSLPHRYRPWQSEERIRVHHVYVITVGIVGLGTGHVWLAIAGVLAPYGIILVELLLVVLAPRLCAEIEDASAETSPPNVA